jgi:hypothetical protein
VGSRTGSGECGVYGYNTLEQPATIHPDRRNQLLIDFPQIGFKHNIRNKNRKKLHRASIMPKPIVHIILRDTSHMRTAANWFKM